MLGFFKSRNDKISLKNQRSNGETKEQKRNTLKKSKSEENGDKPKETKQPRFSFKRSRADRKKRNSTLLEPIQVPQNADTIEKQEDSSTTTGLTTDDESIEDSSVSSLSVDKSEDSKSKEQITDQEQENGDVPIFKSASLPTQWSYIEKRKMDADRYGFRTPHAQSNYSYADKRYGTLPLYQGNDRERTDVAQTFRSNTPSFTSKLDKPFSASGISSNCNLKQSAQSFEECPSIRSTPSSSTSSLSSISGRPISPSGRKTPPGPKMGTGICLSPSPTYARKHFRTNIKTNPSIPARKVNASTASTNSTIIYHSPQSGLPPISIPKRPYEDHRYKTSENKFVKNNQIVSESSDSNCDSQDDLQTPPLSPISSPVRARHSASSMHSLESIPETDADVQEEGKEQNGKVILPNLPKRQPFIRMLSTDHPSTNSKGNNEEHGLKLGYNYYPPSRVKQKPDSLQISNKYSNSPILDRTEISLKLRNLSRIESNGQLKGNSTSSSSENGSAVYSHERDKEQDFESLVSARVVLPISENVRMPKSDCNVQKVMVSSINPESQIIDKASDYQQNSTNPGESVTDLPSNTEVTHAIFSIPVLPAEDHLKVAPETPSKNVSSNRTSASRKDPFVNKRTQPISIQTPLSESRESKIASLADRKTNEDLKMTTGSKDPRETKSCHDFPKKESGSENSSNVKAFSEMKDSSKVNLSFKGSDETKEAPAISSVPRRKSKRRSLSPHCSGRKENEVPIRPKRARSLSRDKRLSLPCKIESEDERRSRKDGKSDPAAASHAAVQTDAVDSSDQLEKENLLREVENVEKRYQDQVDQLSLKLSSKQQESKSLKQELDKLKQSCKDDNTQDTLKEQKTKIDELTRRIAEKDSALEGIKFGLQHAKSEAESSKEKILQLENELKSSKQTLMSNEEQTKNKYAARANEFELKVKVLEEKLERSESSKKDLQKSLNEIEEEREEELKIVQDALDEAAQEREELIATFKKELDHVNKMNATREQQMLEDFEWKLREMQKDHKKKLEDKEKKAENTLTRSKRVPEDEDFKQKLDKMRSEINSEWEDKLRSECSRLKRELDKLHSEEKHLAVESIKVQKDQEIQNGKTKFDKRIDELNKSISTLKDRLAQKEAYYNKEIENARTNSDRDIWSLRMKLQKLDESSTDKIQQMDENHREEMERLKTDYEDRVRNLEKRLDTFKEQSGVDLVGQITKDSREQMQHLEEQHKLSMQRFIEESEAEKFQAVEEARIILTKHHEDIENGIREQLSESLSTSSKLRQELDSFRVMMATKEKQLQSMEEGGDSLKSNSDCDNSNVPSEYPSGVSCTSSGIGSSQFSLASSNGSQSQERLSLSELSGLASDSFNDEAQKAN